MFQSNDCILRVPKDTNCPVELTEKPVSVTAPLVPSLLITLNPPSDRIGPGESCISHFNSPVLASVNHIMRLSVNYLYNEKSQIAMQPGKVFSLRGNNE